MSIVVGIAGISAKLAQCVTKALQKYPGVKIKGFCRSLEKMPPSALQKYNLELIQGNFDDEVAVQKFVRGTDVVICCYFGGPEVMTLGQKILIDACAKEGVSRYIPSDFAVDYTKIPDDELFPKDSTKIIKNYLSEKGVAGVHILVGGLMETFWSDYFEIYDADTQTASYWGTGEEKWDLTSFETAAAYTAALAVDKEAVGIFRFRGDFKSIFEIKQAYDKVYQSPLRLKRLGSLADLYNTVKDIHKKDPGNLSAWGPKAFIYWCTNGVAHLGDELDYNKYPYIVPTSVEEFLRARKKTNVAIAYQEIGL
ncbi:NmrA-like family protein [Colletotrichum kahawae]|uniref:NmrA-like family protein n=1 Tax=Colletotrichum kahawae TaxID=34407 RepID=A0AAD9Y5P7_COLKA|nr:NmrA-like family protein [Colletotrichum kahawae]